jgi:hypothetical protein
MMRGVWVALVLVAGPAFAESNFFSDAGDEYIAMFNAHGAVLTSVYPKAFARFEPWEDHRIERGPAVIAFGKDCDALHSEFGKGRWVQANGGFFAEFERGNVGFVRQELVLPSGDYTWLPSAGDEWPGNQPDPKAGGTQP